MFNPTDGMQQRYETDENGSALKGYAVRVSYEKHCSQHISHPYDSFKGKHKEMSALLCKNLDA
jgi:hypothetical protein